MKKIIYILGIIIISVIVIVIAFSKERQISPQENATKIYEQMIMDNAVTVIEKIPTYVSSQRKICTYKEGFLIEDPYNAEWYVSGNKIFAVNGLAKSLTPNIEYAPEGIFYQSCY